MIFLFFFIVVVLQKMPNRGYVLGDSNELGVDVEDTGQDGIDIRPRDDGHSPMLAKRGTRRKTIAAAVRTGARPLQPTEAHLERA